MCSSGDQTATAAEKTSAGFQDTLTKAFQTQFGQNQDLYKFLSGALTKQITDPQGYGDAAVTAMRTNTTDTIASQYQNAQKVLQNKQFTQGGENLPSGVNAMQTGALAQGQAADTAKTQNDITTADATLKNQNYWNAISGLNGVNQGNSANGTAGQANGASGATADLSNAVTSSKAQAMSPFNALIGAAGGVGAAALYGKKP